MVILDPGLVTCGGTVISTLANDNRLRYVKMLQRAKAVSFPCVWSVYNCAQWAIEIFPVTLWIFIVTYYSDREKQNTSKTHSQNFLWNNPWHAPEMSARHTQ